VGRPPDGGGGAGLAAASRHRRTHPITLRTITLRAARATLAAGLLASAPAGADALDELESRDWQAEPGVVFGALRNGEVVLSGAYGLGSLEHAIPLGPETLLNAGSVAKTFTAYAALRLEHEGRLSLDDELHRHLPDWPHYDAPVTLRQMLQHTAGLKDYWALSSLAGQHAGDVRTHAEAVRLIRRQPDLNFVPGIHHLYSNSGYILLAEVIAQASGTPFPEWTRQHVFEPLGMRLSRMQDDPLAIVPASAESYRSTGADPPFRREPLQSGVVGSGNLLTTVPDLLRWGQHLMTARLGERPLLARMAEEPVLAGQRRPGYGLGIGVGEHRGTTVYHHGGANAGFRSHLLLIPGEGLAVAVLANAGHLRAAAIAEAIADRLLPDPEPAPDTDAVPDDAGPPLPLAAYTGLFLLDTGMLIRVREVDGVLVMVTGGVPQRLEHREDHAFAMEDQPGELSFEPDAVGAVAGLRIETAAGAAAGTRQKPLRPGRTALRALAGRYLAATLDAVYHIEVAGDGLELTLPDGTRVPLAALRPDLFVHWDLADFLVRLERDRRGRVRGFTVSVTRAFHVPFTAIGP
jgi:CubicO group peptidase (beta-lactamase class C family)